MMSNNCCICEKEDAPYKCPTCRKFYCSVACCKEHKTQSCEPPKLPEDPKEDETKQWKYEFLTEDTVPMEKLQQLRNNEELKESLRNRHLRSIMKAILNSSDPTEAIALAMKEPIFVEMADACLKVVEPPDEVKPY